MHTRRYEIQSTLTIAVRPLVASPPEGPRRILPHFYAENLPAFGQDICELHGWSARSIMESIEHEMWDAIILDAARSGEAGPPAHRKVEHNQSGGWLGFVASTNACSSCCLSISTPVRSRCASGSQSATSSNERLVCRDESGGWWQLGASC